MADLFEEYYQFKTLVEDARRDILQEVPYRPDLETKDEYLNLIINLTNEEVQRRRKVMGFKNPDYSNQNIRILRK